MPQTLNGLMQKLLGFLRFRTQAYRRVFEGSDGRVILADLARFCRANRTTFHVEPRAHALAEGRREVWLRIQQHLNLSEKELWELLQGEPYPEEDWSNTGSMTGLPSTTRGTEDD